MKRMQRVFGDLDALMFVDDRLDDERRAAFLAHLADDKHEAERVGNWSRQNDIIRASFASIAVEPVPLWLRLGHVATERSTVREIPTSAERRPRSDARPADAHGVPRRIEPLSAGLAKGPSTGRRSRSLSVGIGAAALLAAGTLLIVASRALLPQPGAIEEPVGRETDASALVAARAVDAYQTYAIDPLRPVELPATQQPQLDRWLQRRTALAVRAPDLHAGGWTALGGRLVPGVAGPAAYYLYEGEPGERLGIFIGRNAGASRGSLTLDAMAGGGAVLSWTSGQTAYVVTVSRSLDWLSRNAEDLKSRVSVGPG